MRPAGPASEAGCILKGPRARVTRGDGTVTKWRTAEGGCGPPGRAYKGAPPTPIFRGSASNKAGGHPAAVHLILPCFCLSYVRGRSPQGGDPQSGAPLTSTRPRQAADGKARPGADLL